MSWLRLSDDFLTHPKVAALTDRELRVHLAAMLWAARHKRLHGKLPPAALRVLNVRPKQIERLVELGLWDPVDEEEGSFEIHDFCRYNPADSTAAERQRRRRENGRDAP